MNDLRIFNSEEFGEIRTVIVDGEVWFVGRDVAVALGYAKPQNAIRDYVAEEDTLIQGTLTNGGKQQMLTINESGLYSMIFGSKLEGAKRFKKWVTKEVLPSIRKTGSYTAQFPTTTAGQIQLLAKGHVELEKKIEEVRAEVSDTQNTFKDFQENCPMFPIETDAITKEVRRKGVEIMGGKHSTAYHDKGISSAVYKDIYGEIHRNFDCNSYKSIPRKHITKVLEVVRSYTLPIILQERIAEANM